MAESTARAAATSPDDGTALVDPDLLRSLRGAERPGLPDASQPAPVLVGHVADRVQPAAMAGAPEAAAMSVPYADGPRRAEDRGADRLNLTPADAALASDRADGIASAPAAEPAVAGIVARTAFLPQGSSSPKEVPARQGQTPGGPQPDVGAGAGVGITYTAAPVLADPALPSTSSEPLLPAASPPRLAVRDATTLEDTAVLLDIAAALADRGSPGGDVLMIVIDGLPAGAALSAGTRQPDGTWVLSAEDLAGLRLLPPQDWSGEAMLSIRAIVTGTLGDRAETATTMRVIVEAVADAPRIAAAGSGDEDTAIPLALDVRTTDIDGSERIVAVRIAGVPDGAVLSAGSRGPDGVWMLDPAGIAGLTLTPPLHFSGPIPLVVTAVSAEPNGSTASTSYAFTIMVTPAADAPFAAAADSAGDEDSWIPLSGLSAALVDADGSESLVVAIVGLPDGAILSAGERQSDGTWLVPVSSLGTLALRPPENFSGTLDLALRATASETGAGVPDAITSVPFRVAVAPVVDAATISGSASGQEDSWITLHAAFATPDADGSERWAATSLIGEVPAGAILSEGIEVAPGTWQVDTARLAAGLISLRPPADSDADFQLTLTTTLTDSGGGESVSRVFTGVIPVEVAAIADAPMATASDATGAEDSWIPLAGLSAALADIDGSESLAVHILGMPEEAVLSAGTRLADGRWQVAAADLATLSLRAPEHFAGQISLTLRATATEADPTASVASAVTERPFTVTVTPAVDGATISGSATGAEDSWITLSGTLGASPDPSERWDNVLTIAGLPTGAVLNIGTDLGGGVWQVAREDFLAGRVAVRPPTNSDADFVLTLTGTMIDAEAGMTATRSISAALPVTVIAVADTPYLAATDVSGHEDARISLNIAAALADADGSEALSVAINGLPDGAALSAGGRQPDGSWIVPAAALPGLVLTPPPHFSGILSLSVTATSSEARDGSRAAATLPFTVTVAPVVDAGSVIAGGRGAEDSWIAISANFITPDTDGSEGWAEATIISGVPAGALLSQGQQTGPGVWTVSTAELAAGRVSIRPPVNSDADFTLTLVTTLTDEGAGATDTRTVTGSALIEVLAVADTPAVFAANAAGSEDTWIRLTGLGGALADTDGSESLSFRISGLPSGARLSAGTQGADGSWTLTPAQLAGVSLRPPANFSGTLDLTLSAIATEARDGRPTATSSTSFQVVVDPVVDAGTITGSSSGREDTWIALRPRFRTPDTDGSEQWGALTTIAGVPADAVLSQGTRLASGDWEVSTEELAAGRVSIRPPPDSDGDFTLRLTTTLTDTGNGRTDSRVVTGDIPVTVIAVADAPTIAAASVRGSEDSWIPLSVSAELTDRDGSESLMVRISGVPDGALLSAGTPVGGGVWQVDPADLPGLALQPPRDFSGSIRLKLTATSTDNDSSTATRSASFTVTVDAVADMPTVRVAPAVGSEDTAIPLVLSGRAVDLDGSETLAFYRIADVPPGAVLATAQGPLAAEADGSFLVRADRAASLTITPPRDSDADFTLHVSAIAREPNGSTAESVPVALPVRVLAVADAPVGLSGGGRGLEDTPVPLNISARLSDTDGSERLYFVVSGVPAGMSLSAGTYAGPGRWSLTSEEAATAALITPRDWSGRVTLTLSAVAQEQDGGSSAVSTIPITLDVAAVVDTPAVVGPSGATWPTARGAEDSWIALDLDPGLRDSDGSESVVGTVALSGLPAGAVLGYRDGTVLTPAGGAYSIPVARMGEVVVRPPHNSDVAFDLTVRMTIADAGGVQQSFTGTLRVDPEGRADAPDFQVANAQGAGPTSNRPSDGRIALPISLAVTDTDGSETARLILRDVPDGFRPSAGRNMGNGVWVLEPGDQQGLTIRPPVGFTGAVTLRAEALVTEREGDSARATRNLVLTVQPGDDGNNGHGNDPGGYDPSNPGNSGGSNGKGNGNGQGGGPPANPPGVPSLSVTLSDGQEDAPLGLAISGSHGGGGVGTITLTYVVEGLPPGARLSAGFHDAPTGRWLLSAAELAGLQLIPPAHFAGPIDVRVSAIATDAIGQVARTSLTDTAMLEAVADGPVLAAAPAAGIEDTAIALNLSAALIDRDGSETISAVTISGLPAGAQLVGPGLVDNGNGSYAIDPAHLGALRVLPPPDAHGSFALTLSATTTEASNGSSRTATRTVQFTVGADPDAPVAVAADAAGIEDAPIALLLSAALADTDGSEVLSVVIAGLPQGAILSAGINNGNGSWTLLPAQLPGLTLMPPRDFSGTIIATLTAHAMERSTGAVASTVRAFTITVTPVADTPIIALPERVNGLEDTPLPVHLQARLTDTDGSEVLSVIASDVPAGGRFSAGTRNPDGSWTFQTGELAGLAFIPPEHFSGEITLRFTAVATEPDGSSANATQSMTVVVGAVADAPLLSAPAAVGIEDVPTPLPISVALADTDGSETLQAIGISGLPPGFRLSAGTDHGNGSFTVPITALPGLALLAPADWNGTLNLSVTATATEATGGSASITVPLGVTIAPANDAPDLSVTAAAGTTAGASSAAIVSSAGASDVDGDPVAGATVSLGAGRQPDDALMVQGFALHAVDGRTMIGDTGIELVGGGFDPATGTLSLAGNAPQASYQAVLGALVLVNGNGDALEAGERSITIELRDPAGASDAQTVTVTVAASVIHGDGADATLAGTGAADTFHGSAGNEVMQGGAGHDLFLLSIGGGHDSVDGGAGHDTIALSGVAGAPTDGPPPPTGWQLVLDGTPATPVQGANSLDFSEPVAGHIVMGDGTQVDFTGIERITW